MGLAQKSAAADRGPRRRTLGRLGAVSASALIIQGALGPLVPAANAGIRTESNNGQAVPGDLNTGATVDPIPYIFPDDGGGGGGGALDPSIAVRPEFEPVGPPEEKEAVADAWSRNSRVWANPDGTYTLEYGRNLNFENLEGVWAAIDLSLVEDESGIWAPKSAPSDVRLYSDAVDGTIASLTGDDGEISLRVPDAKIGARVGETLEFADLEGQPKTFVRPSDEGFEFGATLADPSTSPVVRFILDPGDLTPSIAEDGRSLIFVATSGTKDEEVGGISAPRLYDEAAAEGGPDDVIVALEALADGTYLLSYSISTDWLAAKERVYPVTLDPTACIRAGGGTGCDVNGSTGTVDIWYGSGQASSWVTSSSSSFLHTGWYLGTGDPWGQARSALYFPGVTLPDGAMVTSANLAMREANNYSGGTTAKIYARLINKSSGWALNSSSATWNSLAGAVTSGYDSPQYSPCNTGATDCTLNLDVTKIVRAWYTRRGPDWRPNAGIQLRYATEGTSHAYDETSFYRYNDGTTSNRPQLTITYEIPKVELDFDAALGPTYAPSTMIKDQATLLPVKVTNNASFTFDSNFKLGWRLFDMKGVVVQTGTTSLPVNVASGTTSAPFAVSITPTELGQFSLRLDLVKVVGGVNLFASDWAKPALFYSRNKKVLTSDSTRWTGSSVIERDDFGIKVITGQGGEGTSRSVATGDGGQVSINLWSKNLGYEGNTGLGFGDRMPIELTYGYNSKATAACTGVYLGILGACGWFTNWDERVTAGSIDGDFTYFDSHGGAHLIAADSNGQLVGAPVQLSRVKATLFDENRPTSGGTLVAAASESPVVPPISGPKVVRVPSNTNTVLGGFTANGDELSLNTYRTINFALRTTNAATTAVCFEILNKTTGVSGTWICLVAGTQGWSPGAPNASWPSDVVQGNWSTHSFDLWEAVAGLSSGFTAYGAPTDDFYIKTVEIRNPPGSTGYTYLDDLTLSQRQVWRLQLSAAWTNGASVTNYVEGVSGNTSTQIADYAECTSTCHSSYAVDGASLASLQAAPIARWWWKKAGGASASMEFYFKDLRQGSDGGTGYKTGTVTYYAGPTPPTGAVNPVQVSPYTPGHFTRVTRNILEDARQILNMYNDAPPGTSSTSVPTQGPTADPVQWTGFEARAVDGQYLLLDDFELLSGPEWATLNRYADTDISASNDDFTYDFQAELTDGSTHYFNRDGLLTRIVDKNQNRIDLDWTYASSGSGQTAYTLTAIHAPGDATVSGGNTYDRQIDVTKPTPPSGFTQWTFTEKLGTVAAGLTGRRADFFVATATGATWGANDLVKVSPARHNAATCGSAPSGCVEFGYTSTTSHLLKTVADPRKDGTTDATLEVTWTSGNPTHVLDKSHGNSTLLRVISFDRGRTNSPLYLRPLYQDAAAVAASYAIHLDLTAEGSTQTEYIRQGPCTSNDCGANPPSDTVGTLGSRKAIVYAFDGLAHVTSTTTYRCPGVAVGGCTGTTALRSVERRGTNAGAKVDNYADALAAAEVAWTQSADQHFASLRDSGGTNEDLYRTEYRYNGVHSPTVVENPVFNRNVDYPGTVKSAGGLSAYWRLGETSGALADSSGNGFSGTGASVTYSQPGAMARDASTAVSFNGSTSKITTTATISTSSYTIEAWVNLPSTSWTNMQIAGRWSGNLGARLYVDTSATFAMSHNAVSISAADSKWYPQAGRWYHVVGTWDGAMARLYVDGDLLAQRAVSGATGAGGSNFIIGAQAASGYFNGLIDEVALRSVAIDAPAIRAEYQAGRGIATVRVETSYGWTYPGSLKHLDANPTQLATQLLANGDFSNGLNHWSATASATYDGLGITLPTTATAEQVAQLLPGQRVHFQVRGRTDGTSGSTARLQLSYWRISTSSWASLIDDSIANTTSWTTRAFQSTVPSADTTGLLRVALSDGTGIGQARFDDVLLVTAWSSFTYRPRGNVAVSGTAPRYLQDGLLESVTSFGHVAAPTIDKRTFAATTAHPAIFTTAMIANYFDGTQGPGPDEDVTASATYDSWGRRLTSTDPDGILTATVYHSTNKTDVVQTIDGLNNSTTMTYDVVGNVLSTTSPLGRVTSATYDARNHPLTTTGPDGVVSRNEYDNYGRATASFANYVNGVVEPSDGDLADDLLTTYAYDGWGRPTQQDVDCGSIATCATGGLDARTVTSYDLLGNVVATTTYPASNGGGTARTTTNHFEAWPQGSPTHSRTRASGVQLPIAPSSSTAPLCPGSATVYCNAASVWEWNNSWVGAMDMNGLSFATTDGYGVVSVMDYDLGGRQVSTIANFDAAAGSTSDTNVVGRTEYNLAGGVIASWDSVGRRDEYLYDPLGRVVEVSHKDVLGVEYTRETSSYLPSGRTDGSFDGSAWTKTEYDGAGRAVRTIANWDQEGNAGMTLDALEGTVGAWQIGASGFFTGAASSAKTDDTDPITLATAGNAYHAMAPVSGRGRLRVTTHATSTDTGVWLDLSGPTYQSGHVYKASFDLAASASGLALTSYLGQDSSGGSFGSASISSNLGWTRYTVSWTAGASLSTPVHFAIRKAAAGEAQIYLDNLVVWDSTVDAQAKDWSQTGIVSSVTAYDADGAVVASVLPPGDPATERPFVTTVAFDEAGRTVSSVTNGTSGAYAAIISPTSGLAAYFPLDERVGANAADKKPGGGTALTIPATLAMGVAGGIDEARTAARFTGANGHLSRSSNATSATTNVSLEAWIRSDVTPAATVVIASNGTNQNGWGLAIDSAGNASGFTINGSTFTTMASTKIVTDGAWHHLVLTRGASTWALALDGVAKTLSNNTTSPGSPGASFTIGALSDGTRAFAGEVDEVAVYTADIAGVASAHWAAGRKTDAVTALTTRNAYDRLGRVTDAWTPALVRTKAVYDRLGNQTETIANYLDGATTGGTAADDVKSTFAYDVLGELIGYCPAEEVKVGGCDPATTSEAQAWHYEFDLLGRQTKTIPPDNTAVTDLTTEEVVYEAGGRIAKTCRYPALVLPAVGACGDPNSRHTDFMYDDLGRITEQKTWDRAGGSDTLKFTKTLTWNIDGSPASVNDGSDTLTYEYDDAGRVSQFKRGSTVLTAYTYTAGTSTIATRTDGTSGPTAFTYDWARRQTIIDPDNAFVAGTVTRTYRLDGLLATQSFPSSLTETLAYDAAKRPLSISLGSAGSISQTFDRAGNITSDARSLTGISGDAGSGTQAFSYDDLSRLTGSSLASNSRSYQYDLDGNRTRRTEGGVTTDFTYDRADQLQSQTIGVTTRTYDYDRYGNLLQSADPASALTTYAYDEANRLKTINPPGGGATQITFTLDALDRHATRAVNGSATDTYQYLDATETAWQTGQGTTTSALLDADGSRLAVKTNGNVSWLVFDLHGSVVALCPSGTSTLSDAYRFDGFGQQIASAGTASNPWRYRGLLNVGSDALTGALLDMVSRHYSPQLGVFTQEDSVQGSAANPMTMNRFLYALANPATLIDPDGHMAIVDGLSGSGAPRPAPVPHQVAPIENARSTDRKRPAPRRAPAREGCTLSTLRCGYSDFDKMSVSRRADWMTGLMDRYGNEENFEGWFNNVLGILHFAEDKGLMTSGSWESWVDASILHGITEGLAANLGGRSASTSAGAAWKAFFAQRSSGGEDRESKRLWAIAEQTATDYGVKLAEEFHGKTADPRVKTILITFGNAYRAGVKDEGTARHLGRELGWRLGLGAGMTTGMLRGASCGWLAVVCAPLGGATLGIAGAVNGHVIGEELAVRLMDPRSEEGAYGLTTAMFDFPAIFGAP